MGIIAVALYSLELTFDKYLIFSKYIKSYEILVFQGVIELILGIISLIIATKYDIIDNFWDYYNQLDKNEIIFLILLIILNSIYYSLIITIIDILSPFFIFIIFVISIMIIYIIGFRSLSFNSVIVRIIFFSLDFLSFIMLLIFTEIIELNCFRLSYMTKRNIELRAQLDSIVEDEDKEGKKAEVDFQGYVVELKGVKEDGQLFVNDTESSKED